MTLAAIPLGGAITSLTVPGADGTLVDVVLGLDDVDGYRTRPSFLGAIIGRYANRIREGHFELDGALYELACNDRPNHLHGGERGFDVAMWEGREIRTPHGPGLEFRYVSEDGEEGYPGKLWVRVTYALTGENALRIDYEAQTSQPTVINLTQHSYFNLAGHAAGSILDHELMIESDFFTPTDSSQIPTGDLSPLAGTPLDFSTSRFIGETIGASDALLEAGNGFDHNYVIRREASKRNTLVRAARASHQGSGIVMDVFTTEPGLQFYSGNYLDGIVGKGGAVYGPRSGFCLETQHFPDSPNHPHFPSTVLRPGERYRSTTVYAFGIMNVEP
jgi:aldose 1-epimerase